MTKLDERKRSAIQIMMLGGFHLDPNVAQALILQNLFKQKNSAEKNQKTHKKQISKKSR